MATALVRSLTLHLNRSPRLPADCRQVATGIATRSENRCTDRVATSSLVELGPLVGDDEEWPARLHVLGRASAALTHGRPSRRFPSLLATRDGFGARRTNKGRTRPSLAGKATAGSGRSPGMDRRAKPSARSPSQAKGRLAGSSVISYS